jgi:hypothetical protein
MAQTLNRLKVRNPSLPSGEVSPLAATEGALLASAQQLRLAKREPARNPTFFHCAKRAAHFRAFA